MVGIEEIKNQISIVDLVSESVKLRRTGKNYIGFCPFHSNSRTPAFVIFPDTNSWRCFGQCNEGGDIFSYVMKKEGWDFQQALENLAKRAGVTLEPLTKEEYRKQESHDRLIKLMSEAVLYYQNMLTQHPAGKTALDYLAKRGLTRETIDKFRLGYAPDGWESLLKHLLSSGYSRQELVDTGLVSESRDESGNVIPDGRVYDRFRNRLMIPILDSQGKAIAFGARILNPKDAPKFLNSPQTALFDKGKTLFGLNFAKSAMREKNQAVIVEGYFDVIALHQAGFSNTVSPMGTALTSFQALQLTRQTKRIILALDADAAGENAALKGIDTIRGAVKRDGQTEEGEAFFSLGAKNKLNADIRVTKIPDGMDPDEVALRNPQEWQEIINHAKPIIIHMMESMGRGRDLNDAVAKSEIAAEILPLIYEVANPIERETYRQQLADFLSIDKELLQYTRQVKEKSREVNKITRLPERKPMLKSPAVLFDLKDSFYNKETAILKYLYHYYDTPDAISRIDRLLREYRLQPMSPSDFEQTELHEIAICYFDGINQDEELDTREYIRKNIPVSVRETLTKLERLEGKIDLTKLDEEIARSVGYMRQEKITYLQNEIQRIAVAADFTENLEEISEFEETWRKSAIERKYLDRMIEMLTKIVFGKE